MSKNKKLLFIIPISIIIFIFTLEVFSYLSNLNKIKKDFYNSNKAIYTSIIQMQSDSIKTLSLVLANDNEIKEAYLLDDSQSIISHLQIFWEKVQKEKLIHEVHFFKPPAISFVNFTALKSIGRDVSDIREDIKWVISTKNSSSHTMVCSTYAGIRSTFPIIGNDGKVLGGLSMGKKIDWLPDTIKKTTKLNSFLVYNKNSTDTLIKEYYNEFIKDKQIIGNYILANQTIKIPINTINNIDFTKKIQDITIRDKTYSLNVLPILDFEKDEMGYICILNDLSEFNMDFFNRIVINLFLFCIGSAIIYTILKIRMNRTSKKIKEMEYITQEIKINNFKVLDNFKNFISYDDELSRLQFNIISMSQELEISYHNLELKVYEIEKQLKIISKNVIYTKTDTKGIITFASEAFCKISGYSKSELVGQNHNIVKHPEMSSKLFKRVWDTITKGNSWYGELKNLKKDGNYYWIEANIYPEFDGKDIIGYASIRRDITDKKRVKELNKNLTKRVRAEVEKNIQKDRQMLQQSRLAQMGEMLSMIAHQWRQPLTAISATTNNLTFKLMMDDNINKEEFTKEISLISDYSQHLSKTIDDFRNFFKTNKDKEVSTLTEIVNSTLSIVQTSVENKNIIIKSDLQCEVKLHTYPNEIKQVILNLIKNAEDILLEKKIKTPIITIKTICGVDNNCTITIQDNAGGIPEDIINKVFDPYFSTKLEKDGTGLGLYMSKIIVEEHCGGFIEVSNDNDGAIFKISFNKLDIIKDSNDS